MKAAQEQMRITGDKEMQKQLQLERKNFERKMREQEEALEAERQRNKEMIEMQMRNQLND